ncbi:Hypothetical_protein [Hexamita inflata]|uniref:Hypothetical_protein n=1 Tax=Hexamita inflata TaxID=28002 RepID=A0AA86UQJ7_9EUKA|nr:Hypothetical protein HINF_LOCUS55410 [Hexamita inflata]
MQADLYGNHLRRTICVSKEAMERLPLSNPEGSLMACPQPYRSLMMPAQHFEPGDFTFRNRFGRARNISGSWMRRGTRSATVCYFSSNAKRRAQSFKLVLYFQKQIQQILIIKIQYQYHFIHFLQRYHMKRQFNNHRPNFNTNMGDPYLSLPTFQQINAYLHNIILDQYNIPSQKQHGKLQLHFDQNKRELITNFLTIQYQNFKYYLCCQYYLLKIEVNLLNFVLKINRFQVNHQQFSEYLLKKVNFIFKCSIKYYQKSLRI